ncbi:MAG: TetR/AcrR family transcriptional regulator [Deltaproteobacteria bacterium]|nr:TetR/AcrR family transcriptional regulator [Deltaproteobacteria bacterium]
MARSRKASRSSRTSRGRLSSEEAREAILAATEKRLLEVGPQGLRLQEIARDVGLSHPTVLHHFGSREALVDSVASRAVANLERELLGCFTVLDADTDVDRARDITTRILERIDTMFRAHGHGRVLAWLALTKLHVPRESLLRELAVAMHQLQKARGGEATLEEALFSVLLVSATMFGVALLGDALFAMLGLPADDKGHARFRAWFAGALVKELETPRRAR